MSTERTYVPGAVTVQVSGLQVRGLYPYSRQDAALAVAAVKFRYRHPDLKARPVLRKQHLVDFPKTKLKT